MDIRQFRVSLRAKHFERTCRFYGETLALPQIDTWQTRELQGALYQAGTGVIEVVGRAADAPASARDEAFEYTGPEQKLVVDLVVPSAEAAYKDGHFREKNIPGGLRRDDRGDMTFKTHDPDGVQIVFRSQS